MRIDVWTDGGSRGNPGPAAFGYVIHFNGKIAEGSGHLGDKTNNFAEYAALVEALQRVSELPGLSAVTHVRIRTDSQLLVGHLTRGWKVNEDSLRPFVKKASELLKTLPNATLEWIPREMNKEADRLVNVTLDDDALLKKIRG